MAFPRCRCVAGSGESLDRETTNGSRHLSGFTEFAGRFEFSSTRRRVEGGQAQALASLRERGALLQTFYQPGKPGKVGKVSESREEFAARFAAGLVVFAGLKSRSPSGLGDSRRFDEPGCSGGLGAGFLASPSSSKSSTVASQDAPLLGSAASSASASANGTRVAPGLRAASLRGGLAAALSALGLATEQRPHASASSAQPPAVVRSTARASLLGSASSIERRARRASPIGVATQLRQPTTSHSSSVYRDITGCFN